MNSLSSSNYVPIHSTLNLWFSSSLTLILKLKTNPPISYNDFQTLNLIEVDGMNSLDLKQFQEQVSELLLRHRSLLDVLSKCQQSNAAVHRSVVKAVTECGCIEVNAKKQQYSAEMSLKDASQTLDTHIAGQLCENCLEVISAELGKNLFYTASLCNLLQIDLQEIVSDESKKCSTLGFFNLS